MFIYDDYGVVVGFDAGDSPYAEQVAQSMMEWYDRMSTQAKIRLGKRDRYEGAYVDIEEINRRYS